ncbi:MAG TPA: biotin/lipoyl-binding protein, partial [Vicinamibacterales bacterium]|nr:biotin/lipoyl-binding protein [Vicinamibacterales bacterium]
MRSYIHRSVAFFMRRPKGLRLPVVARPVLGIALIAVAAVVSACGGSEPTAAASVPPVERRVDVAAIKVGISDVESALQISGNLMPESRVAVAARLPGTLARVAVDLGDRVTAGQVVATLDRREIDAQVDAAT